MADTPQGDEWQPWCPDVGREHDWSAWEINDYFPLREDRFCSVCGGMECQEMRDEA